MRCPRMLLYLHAWPRNRPYDSGPPNSSQNPLRFRPAPLCCPEMSRHISLHGNEIEWRVNAWMGLIWITLVWMQSQMTPTAPFCMAAVLHGRPGLGPESGPGRKRGGMNWKAKLMWTSQGFRITNPHLNQSSVDRVLAAQTQPECDPHGWSYLHAYIPKCHAEAGRGPRGYRGTPT
jgi:hypothetical protein